jgi:hypothetical protein
MDPVASNKRIEDVPEGDWFIRTSDGTEVLAHGPDLGKVLEEAPKGKRGGIARRFTTCLVAQGE